MWSKFKLILDLFRKGNEVANKGLYKDGANATFILASFLTAAVKLTEAFGYLVEVDSETVTAIAGGIAAIVLFVINNITSRKAGILPAIKHDIVSEQPLPVPFPTLPSIPQSSIEEARQALDKDRGRITDNSYGGGGN